MLTGLLLLDSEHNFSDGSHTWKATMQVTQLEALFLSPWLWQHVLASSGI